MNARETDLLSLLTGARQFIIPIFQRDYSWAPVQCEQLLQDVLKVAAGPDSAIHFLGSVVYIDGEHMDAVFPKWLVIDGQQRLTTCTLLLLALRERLKELGDKVPAADSHSAIDQQYLQNPFVDKTEFKAKLALRGLDNLWLKHELLGDPKPNNQSSRIPSNLLYLRERIAELDPLFVLKGIRRLMIVSVSLKAGQDNPQLIFESLNSTGLSLTQADLVRNYVLMGHAEQLQTDWYNKYWRPLEEAFGTKYRDFFDGFLRDFLTLELSPPKPFKLDAVYKAFRSWYPAYLNQLSHHPEALERLQRMERFGRYYCRFMIGPAGSPVIETKVARLRSLVDVAAPLVMVLYECVDFLKTLSEDEFCEATDVLESYVFRRSVVGAETRSGGSIFAMLASKINRTKPLPSLKAQLARLGRGKGFPTDDEFLHALTTEDMYHRRTCFFMLSRLTNSGKEKVDLAGLSVEHILPQKADLAKAWKVMLGKDWKQTQIDWLHRLGNLSLTGFNSELQAKPFLEKRNREPGGYAHSPIWLNKSLSRLTSWNAKQIEARGKMLAKTALTLWKELEADPALIHEADLEEAISSLGGKTLDDVMCNTKVKPLLTTLAEFIRGLGVEVIELPNSKTVVYRTPAWFVELLPKTNGIYVRLAAEATELIGISQDISEADAWSFIPNSVVGGTDGSMFWVDTPESHDIATELIRRTHEKVMEDE